MSLSLPARSLDAYSQMLHSGECGWAKRTSLQYHGKNTAIQELYSTDQIADVVKTNTYVAS